jgi:Glycosyltransferase 61
MLFRLRGLVRRLLATTPRLFGYRWINSVSIPSLGKALVDYVQVAPPTRAHFPLPENVALAELSKRVGKLGYSMADVPAREVDFVSRAVVRDVTVVTHRDEWNNGFYAFLSDDEKTISVSGCGWIAEHAAAMSGREPIERIERGAFFFEVWSENYFHWFCRCLPKAILLATSDPDVPLLLPFGTKLRHFQRESLARCGLLDRIRYVQSRRAVVGELALVDGMNVLNPHMLLRTRDAMLKPDRRVDPLGRVFISRATAQWRRMPNEAEVANCLSEYDFELVDFSEMSLDQQIAMMQSTAVLVGLHGAGLTNMLFASPGLHVVEITDPDFPNADYYMLASALGHAYWHLEGIACGASAPGYHDVSAPLDELRRALPGALQERSENGIRA